MPFTFSHPAIILPLAKAPSRWISFTGLVIGSIVPDFEYFIRMRIRSSISHTLPGLFYFDIPVGVLLTFGFHFMIRNALYNNVPEILAQRLLPYTELDWKTHFLKHWWVVIISVFLGALSHLLWDGFTHGHGLFVPSIMPLNHVYMIFGQSIEVYQILQHVSTLIGGIFVVYFLWKLPVNPECHRDPSRKYWPILISIAVLITSVRMSLGVTGNAFGQLAGTSISAFLIALLITPIIDPKKYPK